MFKAIMFFLFLCLAWFGFSLICGAVNAIERAIDNKDIDWGTVGALSIGRLIMFSYSLILFVLSIIYLAPLLLK